MCLKSKKQVTKQHVYHVITLKRFKHGRERKIYSVRKTLTNVISGLDYG